MDTNTFRAQAIAAFHNQTARTKWPSVPPAPDEIRDWARELATRTEAGIFLLDIAGDGELAYRVAVAADFANRKQQIGSPKFKCQKSRICVKFYQLNKFWVSLNLIL